MVHGLTSVPGQGAADSAVAYYNVRHGHELQWDEEAAANVRARAARYPGATPIDPGWCREALSDSDLVAFEPDPKSRIGASRFIGWSSSAGRLLVVIAYRDLDDDLHLINAWPATGIDRDFYLDDTEDRHGEND